MMMLMGELTGQGEGVWEGGVMFDCHRDMRVCTWIREEAKDTEWVERMGGQRGGEAADLDALALDLDGDHLVGVDVHGRVNDPK